jgi:hypothetical protein
MYKIEVYNGEIGNMNYLSSIYLPVIPKIGESVQCCYKNKEGFMITDFFKITELWYIVDDDNRFDYLQVFTINE